MSAGKEAITTIRKEMGITHKEFYDGLPHLLGEASFKQTDGTIKFQRNGKRIEIVLGPEGVREIGQSVRLPITPVTLRLYDFSSDGIRDFLADFNVKYMKGGG